MSEKAQSNLQSPQTTAPSDPQHELQDSPITSHPQVSPHDSLLTTQSEQVRPPEAHSTRQISAQSLPAAVSTRPIQHCSLSLAVHSYQPTIEECPAPVHSCRVSIQEPPSSTHTSQVSIHEPPPSTHTSQVSTEEPPPATHSQQVSIQEPPPVTHGRRVSIQEPQPITHGRRVSIQEPPPVTHGRRVSIQEPPPVTHGRRVSIQEPPPVTHGHRVSIQEPPPITHGHRVSIQGPLPITHGHRVSIQGPLPTIRSRRFSVQGPPLTAYSPWLSIQESPPDIHSHRLHDQGPPLTDHGHQSSIQEAPPLNNIHSVCHISQPKVCLASFQPDVPPSLTQSPTASFNSNESINLTREMTPKESTLSSQLDEDSPGDMPSFSVDYTPTSAGRFQKASSRQVRLPIYWWLLHGARKISRQLSLVMNLAGLAIICLISLGQPWMHFQVPMMPPGSPSGSPTVPINTILFVACSDISCLKEYDQYAYLLDLAWSFLLFASITSFCLCVALILLIYFASSNLPMLDFCLFIGSIMTGTSIALAVLFYLWQADRFLQEGMTYRLGISFYLAWIGIFLFLMTGFFSYLNYMNFWSILELQAVWT